MVYDRFNLLSKKIVTTCDTHDKAMKGMIEISIKEATMISNCKDKGNSRE